MDLPAITSLLSTQESVFRTIIATAKPTISGPALKARLTSHYINLIVIADNYFDIETNTLDDPLLSSSSLSKSKSKSERTRRRATSPSTPSQVSATPLGRTTSYSRPMQEAGASILFTSRKTRKTETIVIDDSDDDSAGSPVEDEDEMFILPNSSGSGRRETRSKKRFSSGAEKERERERDMEGAAGMSAICSSSSGSGGGNGKERDEEEIDAAGFEGGKDGAACDREMEELIQYGDDEIEGGESEKDNEDGKEIPKKRRRSV